MKINTTTKKRFILPLIIIGFLIVAGGATVYAYITDTWPFSNTNQVEEDPDTADINLDPPTQQEIDASQDAKKKLLEDTPPSTDAPSSKETVGVGIAYANVRDGALEVRAFTNGVISGDGTCTVTVSKGTTTVERQTPAFIDVSSTQCEPVRIAVSELESGTWSVQVSFDSPSAQGKSELVDVEVQ